MIFQLLTANEMQRRVTNVNARASGPEEEAISGFSRRRLAEGGGVALWLLAGFWLLSLLSFHRADPSWNRSSDLAVRNWGGESGAFLSDLTLQFVGIAGVLPVLVLAAWGWRLITRMRIARAGVRLAALFLGMIAASGLCALLDAPDSWPFSEGLGGAIGGVLRDRLAPIFTTAAYGFILSICAVPLLAFAFGLSAREWSRCMAVLAGLCLLPVKGALALRRAARGETLDDDEENDAEEDAPRTFWQRLMFWRRRDEDDDGEYDEEDDDEDEEDAEAAPRRRREPKLEKRVKPAVAQSSFELRQGKKTKQGVFQFPPIALLAAPPKAKRTAAQSDAALAQNARLLESVLQDFGVNGEISKVHPGPVVTLYELEPSPGTKSSRVIGLADDISRSMSAVSARIAVIPGRNAIGIELPNTSRETVYLRELCESEEFERVDMKLPLALGKDIGGTPMIVDLARMPHLLVAGTTGSGKSVAINTMIVSLVYRLSPEECKFIMIDPKMLELSVYDDIPHLLSPVVTEPGKAVVALKWTVKEMENRYRLMSSLNVRNVEGYNKRLSEALAKGEELSRTVQTGFDPDTGRPIYEEVPLDMTPLPFIVVVVDEMADLMLVAGKEIETSIQRLAQMARAAGIHIIMATQRPSVDVITGVIKANFPTRISFQVTSRIDSRTILGEQGAEQLLGQGDMLYMAGGGRITRVHGPFISDREVEAVVAHLKAQGAPSYVEDITKEEEEESEFALAEGEDDEDGSLYQEAVEIVTREKKASTSYLQRRLSIGYNRAARLVDRMEREGVVGPANHVGKREVLMR